MTPAEEIHNRDVGRIVESIIRPTMEAGGEFTDILVILESVIVGVLLFGVKVGGDKPVLNMLTKCVKRRLADERLNATPAKGSA